MNELVDRLLQRGGHRTEADIQADIRQFILTAPFELEEEQVVLLESQLGDRRRIDIEVGSTVIEVKRDLRRGRVKVDAIEQLAGYVGVRRQQSGHRYVGVLTDGVEWICYDLVRDQLVQVSDFTLQNVAELDRLIVWLEGVLATTHAIPPTADAIKTRLGAASSAYALDRATLGAIYEAHHDAPTVRMKRELWSRLLTSALGTQFDDTDELFIEHTLLVNSAEIIAHAVLGLPVQTIPAVALLSGQRFDESGIYGVVEPDFFDWVVEVDQGDTFIRTLARRLARFDWSAVEQDVLKVLYESIIGAETRKRLGEYYTPDWLAEAVVENTLTDPLQTRVLDPACGSGTFLFHAVRAYISAGEAAGIPLPDLLDGVTRHVLGMDLHPVAVTLARVTYILAIGRARLIDPTRGTIQIPVYLGDSLQWQEQGTDLWAAGNLVIRVDDNHELFASDLRFPSELLQDAARFDRLVNELARRAAARPAGAAAPSLGAVFQRLAIAEGDRPTIEATFRTMCRLHDEGRDHIWGYYVRNLARPMWLSRGGNKVDMLIGNPPWLAYRFMTPGMQSAFRTMSEARGLWAGSEMSTVGAKPQTTWLYDTLFDVSYELDLFGRVRRQIEAARADAAAAAAGRDVFRITIAAETTRAYAEICTLGEQLDVARKSYETVSREAEITRQRHGAGANAEFDVVRAEGLAAQARSLIPPIEGQRRSALFQLGALLGRTPAHAPIEALACVTPPKLTALIPVGDGAALLKRRPDIRLADRRLAAATARIGVAMADLYPRIQIGGFYGGFSPDAADLFRDAGLGWGIGPKVSWAFPNQAGPRARIRQARAGADAALDDFDSTVLQALKETEQALTAYSAELDRRQALDEAQARARRSFEIAHASFLAGAIPNLDLLTTEQTLIAADAAVAASDAALVQDQIGLFKALGGGWRKP